MVTKHHPTPEERDERVSVPLEAGEFIEGVLAAGDTFWVIETTDDDPRFLSEQGTWATIAEARPFGSEEEARAMELPDAQECRITRVSAHRA